MNLNVIKIYLFPIVKKKGKNKIKIRSDFFSFNILLLKIINLNLQQKLLLSTVKKEQQEERNAVNLSLLR